MGRWDHRVTSPAVDHLTVERAGYKPAFNVGRAHLPTLACGYSRAETPRHDLPSARRMGHGVGGAARQECSGVS